jgi:hypothetical protein
MKKILYLAFLMFFAHAIILNLLFGKLDSYSPKYNGDTDHSIHFIIALFYTFIIYTLAIIVGFIEYKMEFEYKELTLFLVYLNCLLQFYFSAFSEYSLLSSPERFDNLSIVIIVIYFVFELFFSFYVVNRLYKSNFSKNNSR